MQHSPQIFDALWQGLEKGMEASSLSSPPIYVENMPNPAKAKPSVVFQGALLAVGALVSLYALNRAFKHHYHQWHDTSDNVELQR